MQTTPYLYFRGECEVAFTFYESCGLGRVTDLRRMEGTPQVARFGDAWRDKVLHALFEGTGLRFFGSDGPDSEPMKGCALMIDVDDAERARLLFDALSNGGRVTVPFALQFWGERYGNFTDRFGVQWAVRCP
jgi:PhnB protein